MKKTPNNINAVSRRDFLKMSGITALSIGGMTVLTACGPSTETKSSDSSSSSDSKSSDSAASTFGEGGKLRVGMEVAYPPYNWQTSEETADTIPVDGLSGAYADGIDIYVAKKVAAAFDLEPVAVKLAWSGLIEALNSGTIDVIIAGMTPTDERRESIDFSDPYFVGHYGLLCKKDSQYASANSVADLAGASILGQKDTLLDTVIDELDGVTHMTPVDSVPAQLSHVNQGACDCITYNVENRKGLLDANPDLVAIAFDGSYQIFPDEVSCNVGLKKGQDDVLAKINKAIEDMGVTDDTWEAIIDRQPA